MSILSCIFKAFWIEQVRRLYSVIYQNYPILTSAIPTNMTLFSLLSIKSAISEAIVAIKWKYLLKSIMPYVHNH